MEHPLDGVRVIELAHIMAGPVCGRMLADLGADVVKIEPPGGGDPTRAFVPPTVGGEAAAFVMMNRNKRGMVVDLKHPSGLAAARRLLEECDVVIENFRPGVMERLGLGYDVLKEANPGLVYCQITGFGATGPLRSRGGFDLIAQGMTGLLSITGEGPGRPPVKCGPPLTDITAGILGALAVVSALLARRTTGLGQRVESSLFEAGIAQTFWQSAIALATGVSPGPMGSAHPLAAPYEAFPTADGWITIGGSNQASWKRLVDALDLPELLEDPRFATNAERMENVGALRTILEDTLGTKPTQHWLARLEEANVPAGPVYTVSEMLRHPQTLARDMLVTVPQGGDQIETIGLPIKLSDMPADVARGAPRLGEHTEAVLEDYGFAKAEITELYHLRAVH